MRTRLMASAAAIALAAGTFVAAQAQQPGGGPNQGAQTPGAQAPGAVQPAPDTGAPKARPQPKTADPKAQNGAPPKGSAQSKESPRQGEKAAPRTGERTDDKSAPKAAPKTGAKTAPKTERNANITTQQRTEIRKTIVKSGNAPRVNNVNFDISVGTVVPRSVRVAVLPPRVVEIYPQWRGYRYFIVGDEIVIVEPKTLRIVFVLEA